MLKFDNVTGNTSTRC